MVAAIDDHVGAIRDGDIDVRRNFVAVLASHKWPHVTATTTITDAQLAHALGDLGNQGIGNRLNGNDHRDCHAALASRAETSVDCRIGNQVEVGVWQHEHVVLRTAEGLNPLAVLGSGLKDILGDWGRSDERNRLHVWVGEQPVDGLFIAVQNVEYPGWQPRVTPKLCHPDGCARVFLARLEHDCVAGCDCNRKEPHRHHGRKVERADDANHAERLTRRIDIDTG